MDFDLSDGSTFENKFDDDSDAYSPEKVQR